MSYFQSLKLNLYCNLSKFTKRFFLSQFHLLLNYIKSLRSILALTLNVQTSLRKLAILRENWCTWEAVKQFILYSYLPGCCSLLDVNRRFRYAYCLHHQSNDGGSKHLWNVGVLQSAKVQHPRRISSLSSPLEHFGLGSAASSRLRCSMTYSW
jgi:hypothetical protein